MVFQQNGTIFRRDNNPPLTPTEKETIEHLKTKCQCILFRAKTVFPFDFFPDDLIIDTEKVSVIIRDFFIAEQIFSIPIKHITHLSVEHGAFLAKLQILPGRIFQNQVLSIGHLKKKDAIKARNIIQGLVIADKENVTIDHLILTEDGIKDLEIIGKPF